jgi:hypothetical protein
MIADPCTSVFRHSAKMLQNQGSTNAGAGGIAAAGARIFADGPLAIQRTNRPTAAQRKVSPALRGSHRHGVNASQATAAQPAVRCAKCSTGGIAAAGAYKQAVGKAVVS